MIIIKYLKKLDYQRKKNRYLRERIAEATHLKKEEKESEFKDACIPADNLRVHECLAKRLLFRENAFAVCACPCIFVSFFFVFFFHYFLSHLIVD
jgi:hypothetical protein